MKKGELQGIRMLAPDIKAHILPHLIVPPPKERDDAVQGVLMETDGVPAAGVALAKYWAGSRTLLNPKYLFDDFGDENSEFWLPKAFEFAREKRVDAVPVASLTDLTGPRAAAFKNAISDDDELKLAIQILSGQFTDPLVVSEQLSRALEAMGLAPEDCIVLADFTDGDLSQPERVSGVIEGAIEDLESMGLWNAIVFQGTSFPESNTVEHNEAKLVPRNEWKAWKSAVGFDAGTDDHLVFGDYAADSAKMDFAQGGGRPIRHYRYATQTDWFIVRGAEKGADRDIMPEVCRRIIESRHFAGRAFSVADDYIFRAARRAAGPGNAADWRGINTAHHITRVVRDLGMTKGLKFTDLVIEERQHQMFDQD